MNKYSLAVIVTAILSINAGAADDKKPMPGDEMIERFLAAQAEKLDQRFMAGAKTREEWERARPKLKEQYLDMLGLWPLPEKTPLKAKITGADSPLTSRHG